MKERILGRTGLKVRRIGLGGIPIQQISEEEAVKVVRHCYEVGINYFDTARGYTVSEERIGKALEDVRDEVFLATKSGRRTREGLLEELAISLKNLRTDWIDVYQLHGVSSSEQWDQVRSPGGALEALHQARDEGKIHHLGITSHDPALLTEIVKADIFETIMIPYNYLSTLPAEELLPLCRNMSVGTVIMKPFGGGAFSDARIALKFLLGNEDVDVVIPGMMSIAEVDENVALGLGPYSLSNEEQDLIERDRRELGNQFCRACNYCQPCPQEIPISMVLRWETFEKRMGWSDRLGSSLMEAADKADTCIECGDCEPKCPYELPVRELLSAKTESIRKRLQK